MRFTEITCAYCGKINDKPAREIKRQQKKGRTVFFCNNSCGALYSNASQRIPMMTKECPACGTTFKTKEHGKRSRFFCSGVCANQTPRILSPEGMERVRRTGLEHKDNLSVSAAMKSREAWKYVELEKLLLDVPHEFECEIGNYIFDLVLPCARVAVEFDGPDHRIEKQKLEDAKKTQTAEALGYTVVRRAVKRAAVIPSETLDGVVS